MRRGRTLSVVCLLSLAALLPSPVRAQGAAPVRVADLARDIGQSVTVVGRTGYIVSQDGSSGMLVFTLRDDYNGAVMVRDLGGVRPVMGVTYRVTGTPTRVNGTLFLVTAASMMAPAYPATAPAPSPASPPAAKPLALLWVPTVISLLTLAVVLLLTLRRWVRPAPPEWGVLNVTSGPDRGLSVPLHRRRIAIGRGVSPARDVRLSGGDPTISNRHAVLIFQRGGLFIRDTSSNGTRIGGEKLMSEKLVPVHSGDLIHLGTRGTVIIVHLSAPPARGLLERLRASVPLADKTMLLPERRHDGPAWKKATLSPPRHPRPAADQELEEEEELEDDIPHTIAPPLVFTFAGDTPPQNHAQRDPAPAPDDPENTRPLA